MTRRFEPQEVKISIHVEYEDIPVRGNAMASEDSEYDEKVENEIIDDLESGNIFAWCTAVVKSRWAGFEGIDSLGGISCSNEEDFLKLVRDHAMISEAISHLIQEVRGHGWYIDVPENAGDVVSNRFQDAEVMHP
jgi:hypothetical protein